MKLGLATLIYNSSVFVNVVEVHKKYCVIEYVQKQHEVLEDHTYSHAQLVQYPIDLKVVESDKGEFGRKYEIFLPSGKPLCVVLEFYFYSVMKYIADGKATEAIEAAEKGEMIPFDVDNKWSHMTLPEILWKS